MAGGASALKAVVVLITCPSPAIGRKLADAIVRSRLAACVNILPQVKSVFWWKGSIDRCSESLLVIKSTQQAFSALRRRVLQLHPYENPEIIALPIVQGHPPYLNWVASSVSAARKD